MTWDEIEQEIQTNQQGLLERLLPDALSHRLFGDPHERRRRHERRRAETHQQFTAAMESIDQSVETLSTTLDPVIENGIELTDIDHHRTRTEEALTKVTTLRADCDTDYLRHGELDDLDDVETTLTHYQAYLREKPAFDDRIDSLGEQYATLRADADPYIGYDEYLTRINRTTMTERIGAFQASMETLNETVDLSVLGDTDREQIDGLASELDRLKTLFTDYNTTFVDRQIAAHEDLFTDIDAAGHDLNRAQREAVVRNDTYNQVIAAAGTGKTFALTFRVAYLVKQGINPDRIVALTYTGQAATEMRDRLDDQFGITSVDVRTIHSFGYHIAQEAADSHLTTPSKRDMSNLIENVIREETERSESAFKTHYRQFLYHYNDEYLDRTDFESKADYVAERAETAYETLRGEEVASQAEKVIADFLFTHSVEYQYESIAEWANTAEDKQEYRPDFYLPTHDIYIEHWGLDENGEVAPWFSWSTEEYLGKLTWARGEFAQTDQTLIETYDFEHEVNPRQLERVLSHRLQSTGVDLDRLGFKELVDSTFEYHEREAEIIGSFREFISNAKTFDISPGEIEDRLSRSHLRQYHFGQCGIDMLEQYNAFLARNNLIDFDDMIYDAIAAIEESPETYRDRYDHILVDEFQDVAMSQIRLIEQFTGPEKATLFCVGDDWQSIYSFQGSEVRYFIDFAEYFGPPEETYLVGNYRCPATVLAAGNDLIRNNDAQIDKTVEAESGRDTTPQLHVLDGYTDAKYTNRVGEYAADLVEHYLDGGSDPGDQMVLCRYDAGAPYIQAVKDELETREIPYDGKADDDQYRPPQMAQKGDDEYDDTAGVSAFSVHQAKGKEAEHVILLHAASGTVGFPSETRDDELIAPVQEIETNTIAEERRLFYVAITRAEGTLDILTRRDMKSPFVEEIDVYLEEVRSVAAPGELGTHTTITACVSSLWDDLHEKQHQKGILTDATGTVEFVSWTSDDPPTVEEDVWYRFEDLRINEFNDATQLVIEADTSIIELYENDTPSMAMDNVSSSR